MRAQYSADSAWRMCSPSSRSAARQRLSAMKVPASRRQRRSAASMSDGQFRSKHAQVGADLAVENLSKLEIVEFAQALSEQAGYQQRRRKPFRRVAGAHQRSLLFDEFANRHAVTPEVYGGETQNGHLQPLEQQ
jgi:hypothetical protein